jgi:hypothetical protein
MGLAVASDEKGNSFNCSTESRENCWGAAAMVAAVDAGIGALIGLAIKHDDWKRVSPRTFDVAVTPVRGRGVAVAVKMSF